MRKALFSLAILGAGMLLTESALAVCPVCALAVGAGIGISRELGVDDSITGLWVGGLVVTLIMWTLSWFEKKHIKFPLRALATTLGYYLLLVVPLYFIHFLSYRLSIGIVAGSISFWFGADWYEKLKAANGGHAHFPFEKVVLPIAPLIVLTILFAFVVP